MRSVTGAARGFALAICLCAAASAADTGAAAERLVVSGTTLDVTRDPATGAPRTVAAVGSDLLKVSGAAALTRAGIEEAGRRLASRYSGLLGVRPDQLILRKAEKRGEAWYVSFQQAADGVPVFGSSLGFSIDGDGSIRSLGALLYPGAVVSPAAKIPRVKALEIARAHLDGIDPEAHRLLADSTAVLPERNGGVVGYRLVSIFNFFLKGSPRPGQANNGYAVFVDRDNGAVVRVQPLAQPFGCCLPENWTTPAENE